MGEPSLCPKPLSQGSVVRLIAPAGCYDEQALEQGVRVLRSFGLEPVYERRMQQGDYYAGSVASRSHALMQALEDPRAEALWAVRGGSGTAQLLPHVDETIGRRLRQAPMHLVGFSDITSLHGRWRASNVVSLHGANVVNLPQWQVGAQQQLMGLLMGTTLQIESLPGRWLVQPANGSSPTGPLVGGNLTVLASLCGTQALPSFRDCIVFFEDIGEAPYRLDRCLTQLVASGALSSARAIVLGQLTRCEGQDRQGQSYPALALLSPTLAQLGLPVLCDVQVGHEDTSLPLPLGGTATLCAQQATLQVHL